MFMNQLLPIGDPPARLAPVALTFTDTLARIVGSRWFTIFLVLLGLFRSRRLSRIVYERCFSEEGVYEGDEVELIETVRNTGFFPLLGVDIESYFYNELDLEEYEPDPGSTMQYVISRFNLWPYMQIRRHHKLIARWRWGVCRGSMSATARCSPIRSRWLVSGIIASATLFRRSISKRPHVSP